VCSWVEPSSTPRLHLSWRESDGPAVCEPVHQGFGTKLIREALPYESGGFVDLQFSGDGLRCEIDFPLDRAQ
jgi:two-component sensor histidine kinase